MSSLQNLTGAENVAARNSAYQAAANLPGGVAANAGYITTINNLTRQNMAQNDIDAQNARNAHEAQVNAGFAQAVQGALDTSQNNQDAAAQSAQNDADAKAQQAQQNLIANQQQANSATRTALLGTIADPGSSAAVQNVDQQALNTQNALASSTSTNAYQSGDIAQGGIAAANTSVGATGQSAIDEQQAGAQARQDALQQLGALDDSTTAQDLAISATDVQKQQSDITATFNQLSSEASGLDATDKQKIGQYSEQLNYYMNQYNLAVQQGEAGRQSALGWLKLSLGVVATAGALVATVATGGAAAPSLAAAGALDASIGK